MSGRAASPPAARPRAQAEREPAASPPPHAARAQHLAVAVIVTGVMIAAVDTTIVVLALPAIQRSLHIGLASVIWVIIGYLLVITVLATQVGRLGDMFGRVRAYQTGFLVFIVGSLLCALAWSEISLIVFRLLQGVGGALMTANAGAVIADIVPPEQRGRAYGYYSIGWNTGSVLGVVLGGVIVTYVSWRWVFWINVPIGLIAFAVATRVLHDRGERERHRLDWPGMVALALALFGLLWAMVKLTSESFDATIAGYLIGGVAMLAVFAAIERVRDEPMLDLRLFREPNLTPSFLAAMFQALASFAVLFLLLMYLQGVRHLSPLHASALLVPGYLIGGVVGPWGGRVADRRSPVIPATVGLAVQIGVLIAYAQLSATTPLWLIVAIYVVGAVGSGLFYPANTAAVMKAAPANRFGITSGVLRTFANLGMVFSFTVAILVASQSIPRAEAFAIFVGTTSLSHASSAAFTTGLHAAFYSSTSLMVVAMLLSATRLRRRSR